MRLKELRNNIGMTQEQLAQKLKVGQNTVSQWETGERVPRIQTLIKLSQIFNCSLDELLDRDAG